MRILGCLAAVVFVGGGGLSAQQTATQTVTFRIEAISQVSVAGTPSLLIHTATPGNVPASATSSGSTWAVTTNLSGAKVTGSISSDMPPGVTLSVNLTAPSGAASAGLQPLATTPVDLVTNISRLNAGGLPLSYQLDATPMAGTVVSGTRVVTFTITAGV